ncbi:MAG: PAS domain-containing protein [Candidatus Methanoperedens sp.]|nr:PAS domain-containing protein [Candidatus Methanoperedens sp.]MCE8426114.1 PAS domain-containing protein [Candidatus Methanoperedens sp.]MCE8428544.1 PAS domain-containing protein [Candidatus Methanoperedens sp.]
MKGIESVRAYQEDIIESIPSTIIVLDRGLKILYANKNYYMKSGKRERDVVGERLERVFSPMLIEKTRIDEKIRLVFETSIPFNGGQLRYPGGLFFFYKIHPLKEADISIRKVMLLMEDITELTRLEEELRDSYVKLENAYAELKEEDEAKSDFISTASHELRTPLTVINSYLEMFEEGMLGDLRDNQSEKLAIIRTQTDHMIKLVEDMLDTLRLESRKFKIQKLSLKLDEIARSAVDEVSRLADLKEHTMSLKINGELPRIRGDRQRIKQVFGNLLTNAIKYTPNTGKICVELTNEDGHLLVSISDNGIGIAEEEQEKIFEKFYTVSGKSLTRESERMGLGLTIARGIVEAHGGRIWVNSMLKRGSTFYFTLPKGD